jgi:hypothetical protein
MTNKLNVQMKLPVVLLAMAILVQLSHADEWPELPQIKTFDDMQVAWVSQQMKYNGLPMSMQEFTAQIPAEKLLQKYQSYWRSKYDTKAVLSRNGAAYVLGVKQKDYFYSVQVVPVDKKSSMGSLSVSVSPDRSEEFGVATTVFPVPSTVDKLNLIESNDSGVLAENITYSIKRSADNLAHWYQTRLQESGWALLRKTSEYGVQLYFQKHDQHAMVNIINNPKRLTQSHVQVNWVKGQL